MIDREVLVGELRAEQGALDDGGNPVAGEARFLHRVDEQDLRAALLRVVQVLGRHRLVVRDVRADQDDQVALDPVGVGAGRAGRAEHASEHLRRRRVAEPRRVVDVVRAEEAHRLLQRVIDLVRDPARGHVAGETVRVVRQHLGQAPGGDTLGLVPRDAREALLPAPAHHRVGQPSERAQLLARPVAQRGDVREHGGIERAHGVEVEQVQAHGAQVDARHRPVGEPAGSERAAVAHALCEDAPGMRERPPILPGRLDDLAEGVRLLLAEAIRGEAGPVPGREAAEGGRLASGLPPAFGIGWRQWHLSKNPAGTGARGACGRGRFSCGARGEI